MTREEEIENEAHRVSHNGDEFSSFIQGAEWADEHPNGSIIKWQTGEPKENGAYIATYKKNSECDASVVSLYRIGKNWETTSWDVIPSERVFAWCKLSDIEPYKEEQL